MTKKLADAEGFDRVFNLVGGGGFFQWLLLGLLSLQECTLTFHHVGYVFLGAVPDHWCQVDELSNSTWTPNQIKEISIPKSLSDSSKWESCVYYDLDYNSLSSISNFEAAIATVNYTNARTKQCTQWSYDTSVYVSTTVTDFNLVCDRRYLVATIQATYMAGVFAGSLLLGALSDRVLGRRNSVLVSICFVILGGFLATLANSYTSFVILRFVIAMGVAGSFQNCFSLLSEFCDTESRGKFGLLYQTGFAFGYMIMPVFAYYIRDWVTLQLSFSISTLILIIYFWLLPESPRWLASKGREEEAVETLTRVAKINGKSKPHRLEVMVILEACRDNRRNSAVTVVGKPVKIDTLFTDVWKSFKGICSNYVDLIRTPELRKRSFLLWLLFIAVALVYYGISFDAARLSTDPFIPVFLSGLMELPGYIAVVPMARKWGRTPTVAVTFLITGVASIIVACISNEYKLARIIFSMTGKLCISGCFAVIYLLGSELYPTSTRATGLGSAVLMGRFGSILAPYVVDLTKNIYTDMPSVIFGVSGILAGIMTLFLPETKDSEMLENVSAVEKHAKVAEGNDQVMIKLARRFSQPHIEIPSSVVQRQHTDHHDSP